jgi:uncharacterized protein
MSTKMFVNLFISNLSNSIAFFKSIGFSFNPQFSDESGACMAISENNYAMLLTEAKIREIIPADFVESAKSSKSIIALSCDTREDVARSVNLAIAAAGWFPGFRWPCVEFLLDGSEPRATRREFVIRVRQTWPTKCQTHKTQ